MKLCIILALFSIALCAASLSDKYEDSWEENRASLIVDGSSDGESPVDVVDDEAGLVMASVSDEDQAQAGWGKPKKDNWVERLHKKTVEGAEKVKARVESGWKQAHQAASRKINEVKEKVAQRARMLADKVKAAAKVVKEKAVAAAHHIGNKLKSQWKSVKEDATKTVNAVKKAVVDTAKKAWETGKRIATVAGNSLKNGCKLPKSLDKEDVSKAIEECKTKGIEAAKNGIIEGGKEIAKEAKEKAVPIAQEAKAKAEKQADVAKQNLEKLKAGTVKAGGEVKEAVQKTAATTKLLAVEAGQKSDRLNSDAYWNEIDLDLVQQHMEMELADTWGDEHGDDFFELDEL